MGRENGRTFPSLPVIYIHANSQYEENWCCLVNVSHSIDVYEEQHYIAIIYFSVEVSEGKKMSVTSCILPYIISNVI